MIDAITKALGNETRRKILFLLSQGEDYPYSLSSRLNISPRAVMQNLNVLENAGLIEKYTVRSEMGPERTYYRIKKGLQVNINLSPRCYRIKILETPSKTPTDIPDLKKSFDKLEEISKNKDVDIILEKSLELLNEIEEKINRIEEFQCYLMKLKEAVFKKLDNSLSQTNTNFPLTSLIKSLMELGGKGDIFDLIEYNKISRKELETILEIAKKKNIIKEKKIKEEKEYYVV